MTDYTYGHIRPGHAPRLASTLELPARRDPGVCGNCNGLGSVLGFRCPRCGGTGTEPADALDLPEEVDDDRDR